MFSFPGPSVAGRSHTSPPLLCCRTAFAELNVLLQYFSQLLRDVPLRSYHSFTRGPKAAVFQRAVDADRQFPADSGAPPAKQPPPPPPWEGPASHAKLGWTSPSTPDSGTLALYPRAAWQGPESWRPVWRAQELSMHMAMASTVLQTAFGRYADASICKYSFVPPPCLAQVRNEQPFAIAPLL